MKRRHSYTQFTRTGGIFAAAIGFILIAALNSQMNVLFWALGVVSGALLLAGVLGQMALKPLRVSRLAAGRAIAGQPLTVHYRLSNRSRYWPGWAIRITEARLTEELAAPPRGYCLYLGPRHSELVISQLTPRRRGVVQLHAARLGCSFPFGFINRTVDTPQPQRIIVYPRLGILNRALPGRSRQAATAAGDGRLNRSGTDEFFGLREYRPGDAIRSIHWRRSARTGELVVREMTGNTLPALMVVLDLRPWRDLADGQLKCEKAIELAAAWICHGLRNHFAVGLLIPGLAEPAALPWRGGAVQRQKLLEILALLDLKRIRRDSTAASQHPPQSGRRRADYIVIALTETAATVDMIPPGCAFTLLTMDDPQSDNWLCFPAAAVRAAENLSNKEPVV